MMHLPTLLLILLVSFQFGTTYILKEGGVELATWVEDDGKDETRIINADGNEAEFEEAPKVADVAKSDLAELEDFFEDGEIEKLAPAEEVMKAVSKKKAVPVPRKKIKRLDPPPRRGFDFSKPSEKTPPKKEVKRPSPARMSPPARRVDPEQLRKRDEEREKKIKEQAARAAAQKRKASQQPKTSTPKKTYALWDWTHNQEGLTKVLRIQRRTEEPILLYFENSWSPYSKRFNRDILQKDDVRDYMSSFLRVRIDQDQEKELFKKYRIRSVPAFIVQLNTGNTIPIRETSSASLFLNEIKKAAGN